MSNGNGGGEPIRIGLFGKGIAIVLLTFITGLCGIGVSIASGMYEKLEEINKTVTELHVNIRYIDSTMVKISKEIVTIQERIRVSDLALTKLQAQFETLRPRPRHGNGQRKP